MTENEKVAVTLANAEGREGLVMNMSGETLEDYQRRDNIKKFNEQVDRYAESLEEHFNTLAENTEKLASKIENVEIMPIGNYVLAKMFDHNPFQRMVVNEHGFITDLGGMNPVYKNTDNGEIEEEEQYIKVLVVVEVGPECKWAKVGDTIMAPKLSIVPVPFYKQNLQLVNEPRIIAIINEGLTERFNKNGK